MIEMPATRYAEAADGVNVAYQVFGEGSVDLVIVPGWVSHLELIWDQPQAAAFLTRLSKFSRVILFDKRGAGLSDPVTQAPSVDERMDDIDAVMRATATHLAIPWTVDWWFWWVHSTGSNLSPLGKRWCP